MASDTTGAEGILSPVTCPGSPSEAPVYDCWNTIGVAGNGSCRELLRFVHCRNCPVYSAAAIQLLDRPLSDDYRRERTEHYAQEQKLTTPARTSVVIFRVVSEWLALPTQAFQEVAEGPVLRSRVYGQCGEYGPAAEGGRALHTLPHRRRGIVLGLVNVRGELLVCVSLGRLLGLPGDEWRVTSDRKAFIASPDTRHSSLPAHRLLVANWDGNRIAFPVDEVPGTHHVHREQLREPPATVVKSMHSYSRGVFAWRDHTVGFLDADALFSTLNRSLS